jgi:predicted NAD/FAD-dependent oxidoreductase
MPLHTAIVGAGIAGLSCAAVLRDAGHRVTVFDKSRGPGGRTSTRRTDSGHRFDHGCVHLVANDPAFAAQLEAWRAENVVAPLIRGGVAGYAGIGGMNAVCRHLARDLQTVFNVKVASIEPHSGHVRLGDDQGASPGVFDRVVVSVPAPQVGPMMRFTSPMIDASGTVRMQPRWVAMIGFDREIAPQSDGLILHKHQGEDFELTRSTCNTTGDAWVIAASRRWTMDHLEREPGEVAGLLLRAATESLRTDVTPTFLAAHRWRYAFVDEPLGQPCLWDADRRTGICGDWCLGWTVESAWQSGNVLARLMLE